MLSGFRAGAGQKMLLHQCGVFPDLNWLTEFNFA